MVLQTNETITRDLVILKGVACFASRKTETFKEHNFTVENIEYDSLLKDMAALLKQHARGKPRKVTLSMETAALLESVTVDTLQEECAARKPEQPEASPSIVKEAPADYTEAEIPATEEPALEPAADETLEGIAREISTCRKCSLAGTRSNTVPGEGNPRASLVFVGEAPGASEDRQGRPFVGRAGQLLTDIITKGMRLEREDVYICNVLKCRPPENRTPNPEEVMFCEPYLLRQLAVIQPKVICALGSVAAQTLLKTNAPIFRLRGTWHDYHGIPLRVTYHPAYLLRNPADKAKAWEDIQEIMRHMKD